MQSLAEQIWLWRQGLRPQSRFGTPYARNQMQTSPLLRQPIRPKGNLWQQLTPWKEEQGESLFNTWQKPFKAFGAAVTSPFTPSVKGTEGMPWLQREQQEYEKWQEPTWNLPWGGKFRPTKGLVEFAPWLLAGGVAGAGIKALGGAALKAGAKGAAARLGQAALTPLGGGGKGVFQAAGKAGGVSGRVAQAISAPMAGLEAGMGKVAGAILKPFTLPQVELVGGKLALPSSQMLDTRFKQDFPRRFAQWAETKPLLNRIVKAAGGNSAFVRAASGEPKDVVFKELVKRDVMISMSPSAQGFYLPKLQKYGSPAKLLQIADDGTIRAIKGTGYLYDVLENPNSYTWIDKTARQYVDDLRGILDDVYKLGEKEGIKVPKDIKVHRMVKGKDTPKGYEVSEMGSFFERERFYKTQADGFAAGMDYGLNPNESVSATINHMIRQIADKRLKDAIKPFVVKGAKVPTLEAGTAITRIHPAFQKKVFAGKVKVGEAAPGVEQVEFEVEGLREWLKTDPLSSAKFTLGGKQVGLDSFISIREGSFPEYFTIKQAEALMPGHKFAQLTKTGRVPKDAALDDLTKRFLKTPDELAEAAMRLRADRAALQQGLSTVEAQEWRVFTQLKPMVFPKEVVKVAEEYLKDEGQSWLAGASRISGALRLSVAALDFSAPFIQGLPILGRRPDVWVQTTLQHYGIFAKPTNLYKYMSDPKVLAVRAERLLHGGSSSPFEFYEALPFVQEVAGKIPVAGKVIKKGIEQTYGRAEAAFTGFGEVARNKMWEALKRPNMSSSQLDELARILDRMTGVMSTEALGLGLSQRQFESAFGFFAARYLRAGLSLVGDVFKGGLTGDEARKALGGMMAGGAAMYYGTAKALGQEPNFDPSTGKFMTIKVGDDYIGIGGIMTALARFGADVIATTADNPSDLFIPFKNGRLNRWDNPFIRFLYGRTAPLTSLTFGAVVEKADYFGQPLEDLDDWARFLADKVTPIALQRLWSEEKPTPMGAIGGLAGMRTFPEQLIKTPAQQKRKAYEEAENKIWANYSPQMRKISDQISKLENDNPQKARQMLFQYPVIMMARTLITQEKKRWLSLNRFYQ